MGPSGSGKSTLLGLLIGDLSATNGSILVTSSDKTYPLSEARKSLISRIGYVSAENFIFEGSILENICFGLNKTPNEDDVWNSLRLSGAMFVKDMPMGLQHPLSEQGEGLSAGQKQRLGLARALLRDPEVLILDEATSNLDSATEAQIIKTLNNLKGKMTIVSVTHRDQILSIADQVVKLA